MIVDGGPPNLPFRDVNVGFVTLTICAPNTNACQTIDHVAVDTGSTGLRIAGGVLSAGIAAGLARERNASGSPIAECLEFADGSVFWGWVETADLKLGGETAAAAPIQVLGDPTLPALPPGCTGTLQTSPSEIGANGILGVSNFLQDCGTFCAAQVTNGVYYACPVSGCVSAAVPLFQQLLQPVSLFPQDNNGVLIQLPAVSASGMASRAGSLIFGIGTQANNALGSARVFTQDPQLGTLTISNGSTAFADGFIDSGSNAFFLPSSINNQPCPSTDPVAAEFLCPSPSPLGLSLGVTGQNGSAVTVPVSIVDARALLTGNGFTAFDDLGAPSSDPSGVALGLPFFFGRNVFTAIEGMATPGGTGPYVAF
jgi:hypothetical protein